jgi:hypothetical protein
VDGPAKGDARVRQVRLRSLIVPGQGWVAVCPLAAAHATSRGCGARGTRRRRGGGVGLTRKRRKRSVSLEPFGRLNKRLKLRLKLCQRDILERLYKKTGFHYGSGATKKYFGRVSKQAPPPAPHEAQPNEVRGGGSTIEAP